MKILHIENTAGVPSQISKALCELGHDSKVMETWKAFTDYDCDIENYYGSPGEPGEFFRTLRAMARTVEVAKEYDIIHAHSGINWKRLDYIAIRKLLRKPMVIHYHGSEARLGYGLAYPDFADSKFICTPDLYKWVPDANLLLNPIDFRPVNFPPPGVPTIIHMPTQRLKKGTELILKAIEELQDELEFNFILVEGVTHAEAMKQLRKAHILIDQVVAVADTEILGLIGMTSLEAMSMGKVAVSHIDPEMLTYYKGIPVINVEVSKDSIKEALRPLVKDYDLCKEMGAKGRKYVRKEHSPISAAKKCEKIYREVIDA
jgi:glycosyltransferase involved in cell wall biosynthesis